MFSLPLLPRNLAACERDLQSPDPKVRLSVIRDLAKGSRDAERGPRVALLVDALSDRDTEVRRQSLVSLADLSALEARGRVLALLSDAQIRVRQMAVMCLGEIAERDDKEVLGRLAVLLTAGDPSIRYQALLAYSQLHPADSADDVLRALSDPDVEVRELALRLVDEVLVTSGVELSPAMRQALLKSCADVEPGVRLVAQVLMGDLGLEAPREMIIEVIAGRTRVREPRDEQTSLQLAGKLGLEEATPHLRRRAFGRLGFSLDPFRWTALASLCRLGNARAFEKLRGSLGSRSYMDRTMAAQGLGESLHPEAQGLLESLRGKEELVDQDVLTTALENLSDVGRL